MRHLQAKDRKAFQIARMPLVADLLRTFHGMFFLRRAYLPLIESNVRHRFAMRAWIVIYAFVGIQMAWVLRPFVGAPGVKVAFFREDVWDNAYMVVIKLAWSQLQQLF